MRRIKLEIMSLKRSTEYSSCQTTQGCYGNKEEHKVESADVGSEDTKQINSGLSPILKLSDDMLLHIMKLLDPRDIVCLGCTCQRLDSLARDRMLWDEVDLTAQPMMLCQLYEFMSYFHKTTKSIVTNGTVTNDSSGLFIRWAQQCAPQKMFEQLEEACPALETFIANYHYFDAVNVLIPTFPTSLKKLVLRGCKAYNFLYETVFFDDIEQHMVNLQELILDECQWVTVISLMPISNCHHLRKLSLRHCRNLSCGDILSFFEPFAAGFKSLEVLDVRGTSLGDLGISCFQYIESLTHLYLEVPESTLPPIPTNSDQNVTESPCKSQLKKMRGPLHIGAHCVCYDDKTPEEDNILEPIFTKLEVQMNEPASSSANSTEFNCRMSFLERDIYFYRSDFEGNLAEQVDPETLITDQGILAIGSADVVSRNGYFPLSPDGPNLTDLMILNCKGVTDVTLNHLVELPTLKNLNVCGTSVTADGIHQFLSNRTDVNVVSDYSKTAQ